MSAILRFAGYEIDPLRAELRGPDGMAVRIRPKPFTMLQFLVANAGRVVGKQELMETVWPNVFVGEDNLFQCIREIRTAIGDDRRQILKVVSGRGYLLDADVTAVPRATPAEQPLDSAAAVEAPAPAALPRVGVAAKVGLGHFAPRSLALATAALAVFAVGLAFATPFFGQRFNRTLPVIAVSPFTDATSDPQVALMAANVTDQLVDGLSQIPNMRVLAPKQAEAGATTVALPATRPDYVLRGEIQKTDGTWNVQARLVEVATDEVRWTTAFAVDAGNGNLTVQQARMTAGVGYPFAAKFDALRHTGPRRANAEVVIGQAQAFINRTSPEKFKAAQAMLEKALAADPDNVDLKAELAAQLLRGIQTAWYTGSEAEQAAERARDLLEGGLKAEPDYLPLLQSYCRLLTATNHFADSLIACAKALNHNPWDGLVLFHVGLTQIQLGRYDDALSAFMLADRYDTPQVSRWTWLLGVGYTYVFMDRNEDALPWLERSLAITPGTGRTHFLMAAAYQALGRADDAKAAVAEGMKIRPNTTAANISLPKKNTSPVYLTRASEILQLMIAAGMPKGAAQTSAAAE